MYEIKLRQFPYPYSAALAICSDIDDCDRETFIYVHRFLNDKKNGLGLPVSDSFFPIGHSPNQMAYYLSDGRSCSGDAGFIKDAIRAGLIDSIHSWGDFNPAPPDPVFLRSLAQNIVEEFQKFNLNLKVWINHGSPNNRQNLKSRLAVDYLGDDPQSQYYTADLLPGLGIKFYWWSEIVPDPLSCDVKKSLLSKMKDEGIRTGKNLAKLLMGQREKTRSTSQLTELIQTVILRDNSKLIGFTRYNRHPKSVWHLPTRNTLRYSLSRDVLNQLVNQKGNLILYTHLGLPVNKTILFQKPDINALEYLAELYHDGTIWVAPTSTLLTFQMMKECLEWEIETEGGKTVINLVSIKDPVTGPRLPEKEEISGLCFYSSEPHVTKIRAGGVNLTTENYEPDATGVASVGIKLDAAPDTSLL